MRRSVALFATSGLLPIVALGAVFGTTSLIGQRRAVETAARAHADFAALLIGNQLTHQRRQVAMVAQSPAFDGTLDRGRFRELATRLLATEPDWRFLSVADTAGERLLDVPEPVGGQPGGRVVEPASLDRALVQRHPVIGNVVPGPRRKLAFAVRAPVVRNAHVTYIVSAVVPADTLGAMLRFKPLPHGWRAVLIDGRGVIVAANDERLSLVGKLASQAGRTARRDHDGSAYRFTRRDGDPAVGVYTGVPGTDWTVNVSAPARLYAGPAKNALLLAIIASLVCAALFLLLVRLLYTDLRQARAREAAAVQAQRMEALGRLTGGIAHDFNNLLTPIIGGLDMLKRRLADDPRALRAVDLALTSAERARHLVGRLLSFARNQALAPQHVELGALLRGLEDLIDRSLTPAITVVMPPPETHLVAHVDPAQLELAVVNLAINARDAMANGGTLRISCEPATAAETADLAPRAYVAVRVEDDGEGMDAQTLARALEPFFTTKTDGKGTGLGLSMAHGFARQSGGALLIRSARGDGTCVSIILPAGEEVMPEAAPAPSGRAYATRRILLVDDDPAAREASAAMLHEGGHEVVPVASADAAIRAVAGGEGFDLVVSDYLMPGGTGLDLSRMLEARGDRTPLMIITGYIADDVDLGGLPRLRKPFNTAELLDCVEHVARAGSVRVEP